MNDLLVGVRALAGRLTLRAGRPDEALEWATKAMREIRPGVELAHLVPLALSEVHGALGHDEEAAHHITLAHEQLTLMLSALEEGLQERSWSHIPNHRAIQTRWSALQPRREIFRLPSTSAPLGRAPRDDEYIEVSWAVHQPADERIVDRAERRRSQVVRLVDEANEAGASPTIVHLAQALGSSEATIRRDLAALRSEGYAILPRGSR